MPYDVRKGLSVIFYPRGGHMFFTANRRMNFRPHKACRLKYTAPIVLQNSHRRASLRTHHVVQEGPVWCFTSVEANCSIGKQCMCLGLYKGRRHKVKSLWRYASRTLPKMFGKEVPDYRTVQTLFACSVMVLVINDSRGLFRCCCLLVIYQNMICTWDMPQVPLPLCIYQRKWGKWWKSVATLHLPRVLCMH